jgi:hypothetical protein
MLCITKSLSLVRGTSFLCTVSPPFLGEGDRGRGNTSPSSESVRNVSYELVLFNTCVLLGLKTLW